MLAAVVDTRKKNKVVDTRKNNKVPKTIFFEGGGDAPCGALEEGFEGLVGLVQPQVDIGQL